MNRTGTGASLARAGTLEAPTTPEAPITTEAPMSERELPEEEGPGPGKGPSEDPSATPLESPKPPEPPRGPLARQAAREAARAEGNSLSWVHTFRVSPLALFLFLAVMAGLWILFDRTDLWYRLFP